MKKISKFLIVGLIMLLSLVAVACSWFFSPPDYEHRITFQDNHSGVAYFAVFSGNRDNPIDLEEREHVFESLTTIIIEWRAENGFNAFLYINYERVDRANIYIFFILNDISVQIRTEIINIIEPTPDDHFESILEMIDERGWEIDVMPDHEADYFGEGLLRAFVALNYDSEYEILMLFEFESEVMNMLKEFFIFMLFLEFEYFYIYNGIDELFVGVHENFLFVGTYVIANEVNSLFDGGQMTRVAVGEGNPTICDECQNPVTECECCVVYGTYPCECNNNQPTICDECGEIEDDCKCCYVCETHPCSCPTWSVNVWNLTANRLYVLSLRNDSPAALDASLIRSASIVTITVGTQTFFFNVASDFTITLTLELLQAFGYNANDIATVFLSSFPLTVEMTIVTTAGQNVYLFAYIYSPGPCGFYPCRCCEECDGYPCVCCTICHRYICECPPPTWSVNVSNLTSNKQYILVLRNDSTPLGGVTSSVLREGNIVTISVMTQNFVFNVENNHIALSLALFMAFGYGSYTILTVQFSPSTYNLVITVTTTVGQNTYVFTYIHAPGPCGYHPCICCDECGAYPCICCEECLKFDCICCEECEKYNCICCQECKSLVCICCITCQKYDCVCGPCGFHPCICDENNEPATTPCGNYPCTCEDSVVLSTPQTVWRGRGTWGEVGRNYIIWSEVMNATAYRVYVFTVGSSGWTLHGIVQAPSRYIDGIFALTTNIVGVHYVRIQAISNLWGFENSGFIYKRITVSIGSNFDENDEEYFYVYYFYEAVFDTPDISVMLPVVTLESPSNIRAEIAVQNSIVWDEVEDAMLYRVYVLFQGENTWQLHTQTTATRISTFFGGQSAFASRVGNHFVRIQAFNFDGGIFASEFSYVSFEINVFGNLHGSLNVVASVDIPDPCEPSNLESPSNIRRGQGVHSSALIWDACQNTDFFRVYVRVQGSNEWILHPDQPVHSQIDFFFQRGNSDLINSMLDNPGDHLIRVRAMSLTQDYLPSAFSYVIARSASGFVLSLTPILQNNN